ncbi:Protein disks lost [Eumeta japonica]|uniref:Protein disks lost n=1 Tax=Eumeta variegata TaxID=151549 RepID=A0A4C1SBM3_EUMVA|nr:Protein disks lost [Eumeta japonica]
MIADEYYNYRAQLKGTDLQDPTNELGFIKIKLQQHSTTDITSDSFDPNPYLEALLPIACPFLAEFRVSIMPAKYAQTKFASRTGRYRHITTRIAELPSEAGKQIKESPLANDQNENKKIQNSLKQAFLHSQTSSTLQIIKFCTERCYKSTVKDGQLKILLPAKTNADNLVNKIDSFQYHFVYNSIKTIYADAYAQVKDEWKQTMPKVLHKRICSALDSLLPEETSSVLKKTYLMIIERESSVKMSEWFLPT